MHSGWANIIPFGRAQCEPLVILFQSLKYRVRQSHEPREQRVPAVGLVSGPVKAKQVFDQSVTS